MDHIKNGGDSKKFLMNQSKPNCFWLKKKQKSMQNMVWYGGS